MRNFCWFVLLMIYATFLLAVMGIKEVIDELEYLNVRIP